MGLFEPYKNVSINLATGGLCQARYVHQLHVQYSSTYEKLEAASAALGS
jgi:hypothetical protein